MRLKNEIKTKIHFFRKNISKLFKIKQIEKNYNKTFELRIYRFLKSRIFDLWD
jgi:hypothetical protein